eukprot:SAG11_NODE_10714_length_810_cov_1.350211_1_plen_162_part_00
MNLTLFLLQALGRDGHTRLDESNRAHLVEYTRNVHTMEAITRLNVNIGLLRMHRDKAEAAGGVSVPVAAEVMVLRLGKMILTTFPGELSVRIGLALKEMAAKNHPDRELCVSCYCNGYIFYAPTEEQLANVGAAQEDCDVMLAPGWRAVYETRLHALIGTV